MNTSGLLDGVTVTSVDPRSVKQAMRERIRAERRHRDMRRRAEDGRGLTTVALEQPEIVTARCVAAYTSTLDAPATQPLRQALRAAGVRVLLPVRLDDGHLDWSVDGDPAAEGTGARLGLAGIGQADVMIVPALAVDSLGNRLGQGEGFYDRTLRMIDPTVVVFAFVFESEVLDAAVEPVPAEPHDRPVDAVITPRRCLRLPPRRRP